MAQVLSSQIRPGATRRSAFEIMMDVMRVMRSGRAKPTHIMYKSNTSWTVLKKNLETLMVSGFVKGSGEGARIEYEITPRGFEVLSEYDRLIERVSPTAPGAW